MCTWFKHDSLARQDRKIRKLLGKYGWAGYGVFFGILELMAYDSDHRLENDLDVLAHSLSLRTNRELEMLRYIVSQSGLFVIDEEKKEFYSPRMVDSLAEIDEAKARRKAQAEEPSERPKRSYNLSDEGKAKLKQTAQNARIAKVNPNDNPKNPRKSNPNNPNEILESPETNPNDNPRSNPKKMRGIIGGEERIENGELRIESISPPSPPGGKREQGKELDEGLGDRSQAQEARQAPAPSDGVDYSDLYDGLGINTLLGDLPEGATCTPDEFVSFYRKTCEPLGMERILSVTTNTIRKLCASLRRFGSKQALFDFITEAMRTSPGLYDGSINGWRANALTLLDQTKQDAILNGRYAKRSTTPASTNPSTYNEGISHNDPRIKNIR